MATIENLDVNLRARTQKYETNMKNAGKSTRRFSDTTRNAARGTESFQAKLTSFAAKGLIVTGVITGLAASVNALTTEFAKIGDEIGKAAARTQLTTDDFQTLSFAFEQSGGSASNLETAIKSLSTQYLDLQRGTATSTDLFNRLGITFKQLQGLDIGDQFRLVANSLNNIQDPLERSAVAVKLFGRSGATILPLIKNMEQYEQRLRDIGAVITPDAIKKAEKLTDVNNELDRSYKKLTTQLGELFSPQVEALTAAFQGLIQKVIEFLNQAKNLRQKDLFGKNWSPMRGFLPFGGGVFGSPALLSSAGAVDTQTQKTKESFQARNDFALADSIVAGINAGGMIGGKDKQTLDTFRKMDEQIMVQRALVDSLRMQTSKLAPLPQALRKGTSAQLNFVNQLKRQNQQSKIDAREAKKIELQEDILDVMEDIRDQREEDFENLQEIVIL